MAQATANFVLGKIYDAVFQEVVALCEVNDKVEKMRRELIRIRCFLQDAESIVGSEERVKNWVKELRMVSDMIQEATETFLKEVGNGEKSVMKKIKTAIKINKHLPAKHRLVKKIDDILALLVEIDNSRGRYGIQTLGGNRIIETGSAVRVGPNQFIIPNPEELRLQVVGFEADEEKITAQLLDENIRRRSIVSIVGTAGLGKTTLALKVYSSKAVNEQFDVCIWLSITQDFKLFDLLKKMLQKLRYIEEKEETFPEEYFVGQLNNFLREKKYLIVMDDVCSDDLWPQISAALPDVRNGSRVLMTSRFSNIAKAAEPISEPHVPCLSKKESLQLLLKKALPNQDCPTELLDVAQQFVENCDCLPLALVALGRLLSIELPTRIVWEKMLKTMAWDVDGMKWMNILLASYDYMPITLKTCFMYLACFPKDSQIDAKNLIRLWVSEEFIPEQPSRTLEDTAKDCLEQLAKRNLVTVVRRRYDDSIRTISVDDVLHNLAIDRAKEGNFITVLSNKHVNRSPSTVSCHVALQSSGVHQLTEHAISNLHSLHYFSGQFPDWSRFEKLKVCNVDPSCSTQPGLKVGNEGKIELEGSNELRFLRVVHLPVNMRLGQFNNIETLDLRRASTSCELAGSLWDIKTLRHVIFSRSYAIYGPPFGRELKNVRVKVLSRVNTITPEITLGKKKVEEMNSQDRISVEFL